MKLEKAQLVVQGLKEAGVDFTAGVPDAQFIEVYKMLAEDRDCSEILAQLISARRAIKSLSEKLIHRHLHHCIAESRDRKDRAKKLKELVTVLERCVE